MFDGWEQEQRFRDAWDAVGIVRRVSYLLFTFGASDLGYYLVCGDSDTKQPVSVTSGEVRVKRPTIITPQSVKPEFEGFFENPEEEEVADYLLARSAHFSSLQFVNQQGEKQIVSDSIDEAVDRLNRKLDDEEEDQIAILTAPANLGGVAVLRYTAERIWESAPDNIQELRERGFLP